MDARRGVHAVRVIHSEAIFGCLSEHLAQISVHRVRAMMRAWQPVCHERSVIVSFCRV